MNNGEQNSQEGHNYQICISRHYHILGFQAIHLTVSFSLAPLRERDGKGAGRGAAAPRGAMGMRPGAARLGAARCGEGNFLRPAGKSPEEWRARKEGGKL